MKLIVPRELILYFSENYEIQRFFINLNTLLNGVEPKDGLPGFYQTHELTSSSGKIFETGKKISELEKSQYSSMKGQIFELEKRISELEKSKH